MTALAISEFLHAIRALFMRAEHLTDWEIAGFIDRDLTPGERAVVEAHLDGCAKCRGATADVNRIAYSFALDPGDAPENAPQRATGRQSYRTPVIATALVAAALTIVLVGRSVQSRQPEAPVRSTSGAGPDARAILEITKPVDGQLVERQQLAFSWRSTNADLYRVSIFDETGSPILVRETSDTVLTLAGSPLPPGQSVYLWRVDAISDGLTASSGVRQLRLSR